ncbi:MAG: flagellar motor switch protein FliN [SAR324 cluster bacterium]|nr:flagellar motor switch protein FliN [SAR324 cluster bacterium]
MSESDLEDTPNAPADAEDATEGGTEDVQLDDDLQAALDDAGGEESAEDAGGEDVQLDDDLQAALDDAGGEESAEDAGGEDVQLDDDLQAALDDAGGEESAEAAESGGDEGEMDDLQGALDAFDLDDAETGGGDQGSLTAALGDAKAPAADARPSGLVGYDEDPVNIEFLLDIKLHLTFEVGRAKMLISDLLTLGQGSVVELHRLVGDELDLLINGKLVAKGEVVVVNEKFGCRISTIVPPEDRIKHLVGV